MTFAELPMEERMEIAERIEMIIGKKSECTTDSMSRSERIKARMEYDKTFEKLTKIYIAHGIKALSMAYTDSGYIKYGATPSGKKWCLEMNNGVQERSRYCGTLWIDGEMIFTSGRIEKAFEYILNN